MISLDLSDDDGATIPVHSLPRDSRLVFHHKANISLLNHKTESLSYVSIKNPQRRHAHVIKPLKNESSIVITITTNERVEGFTYSLLVQNQNHPSLGKLLINLTTTEERHKNGFLHYKAFIGKDYLSNKAEYIIIINDLLVPEDYKEAWLTGNFSVRYSINIHESSCYYWDKTKEEWRTYGCDVSMELRTCTITMTFTSI